MARTFINFLAMLAALMVSISVTSWAETTYDPRPQPYETANRQPQPPKCQKINQLCTTDGPYSCCNGLDCFYPQGVAGEGVCVPLPAPVKQVAKGVGIYKDTSEQRQCRKLGYLCTAFSYGCCEGLDCIIPPELPGFGACAPQGTPIPSVIKMIANGPRKCQEELQVCVNYGPNNCCEGLSCQFVDEVVGAGLCAPIELIN